jgi:hypothetical protein
VVKLYTKAECTLCDKVTGDVWSWQRTEGEGNAADCIEWQVKDVLKEVQQDAPHSLVQVCGLGA